MNMKRLHIPTSQGNKRKYIMHDLKSETYKTLYESNVKNKNIYHRRAHFIVIFNSSSVFIL